jgi:hypothetical protein
MKLPVAAFGSGDTPTILFKALNDGREPSYSTTIGH